MGKTVLRELNAKWGQHELDVVCYIPLEMPYSCIADGLVVGTGNSIGRLDIRLAETMTMSDIHVCIQRKDGIGPILLLRPALKYVEKIASEPEEALDSLAHECSRLPEQELFTVERIRPVEKASR